jgi:hypothetical protein
MVMNSVVLELLEEAQKCTLSHKHAAVAIRNGRIVSPLFHNGVRSYVGGVRVDTLHAEMSVLHYLVKEGTKSTQRRDSYV